MNWSRAPKLMRAYLLTAIAVLMLITSMGIFGFLSKAHLDQAVPTGDVAAKVAIIDEKIKTERDNIEAARRALAQMDVTVDQTIARSSDEKGADKAVALRRSQQRERTALQNEIAAAQKKIAVYNEERAPIAKDLRAIEAEVGPIKYIAALIYGENPDANVLEKAVTWVIIIIVFVFDPLAVILLLASQYSFAWFRKEDENAGLEIFAGNPEIIFPEPKDTTEGDSPTSSESEDSPTVTTDEDNIEDTLPEAEQRHSDYTPAIPLTTQYTVAEDVNDEPIADIKESELEDHEILETATISEAEAMTAWKHDHPDSSLKIQRRLFERGIIDHLPWEDYLKPKADFTDNEAAAEALKWAQEQLDERPGDYVSKSNEVSYIENVEGQQVKKTLDGYQQNAEQGEKTIWQRIKKGD
jgi:hypothetical protein